MQKKTMIWMVGLVVACGMCGKAWAQEPTAELLEAYRAKSDVELRAALNAVSDQFNQKHGSMRDQKRELAFMVRTGEFKGEEVEAAKARVAELRKALAAAEQELHAAVLALPEMKERAEALAATEKDVKALAMERAAARQVLAERRPNKGPRPGAILAPEAPAKPE